MSTFNDPGKETFCKHCRLQNAFSLNKAKLLSPGKGLKCVFCMDAK